MAECTQPVFAVNLDYLFLYHCLFLYLAQEKFPIEIFNFQMICSALNTVSAHNVDR